MKVSVIGTGYLGAVHAAAMAELGHDVVAVDVDSTKVASLAAGRAPFVEPGFPELLAANLATGRLRFSTDYSRVAEADVHFVAVGTPQLPDGDGADLAYLGAAVEALVPHLRPGAVVVGKSTVPVGTAAEIEPRIAAVGAVLAWNPEFLREGFAVQDTLRPDRIVYGLSADPKRAEAGRQALDACYAPIPADIPRLTMDYATAELVKVSANAFLATKISFINAMARACDAAGADVAKLAQAIGADERIGHRFLRAGIGFGGGCLPKDIRAFRARAAELGVADAFEFLADVDAINDAQRSLAIDALEELAGGLSGRRIAVLGVAFKPRSDDMRTSPGLWLAEELAARGASVSVADPAAGPVLAASGWDVGRVADDAHSAVAGADAVLLATEWEEYRRLDPLTLGNLVSNKAILDGRNALDPDSWKAAGWTYRGIGRR